MTKSAKISSILGLCFGILAVSTASIFIRFAQQQAPSLVIAASRLCIATLLISPFVLTRYWYEIKAIPKRIFGFLILAGLFLGLHFATWITSLEYTSVASSVVLVTTAPLWVALFSPVFLKEKITPTLFTGLFVSLAGSVIVGLNSACFFTKGGLNCLAVGNMFTGRVSYGNLLALAGAFLSCGYLLIGRRVRAELSLPVYTFLVYGIAALILVFLVVITGTLIKTYTTSTWIWIVLLAIIPQLIGHSTFNYYLKTISAVLVSIVQLGEPIGTIILALLFLHETPSMLEVSGGLLILCGIFIASKANKPQPKQEIQTV